MKAIIKTALGFAALGLSVVSCTKESPVLESEEGQDVKITIATNTRALEDEVEQRFATADYHIETLRVMGFSTTTGMLVFNQLLDESKFTEIPGADPEDIIREAQLTVKTGKFLFVYLANEESETGLATKLNNVTTLTGFKQISISHEAFDWEKHIPMASFYQNVEVVGDNELTVPGGDVEDGTWKIKLDRLGVRADITLSLSEDQYDKWTAWKETTSDKKYLLTLANIPSEVYLMPETDNSSSTKASVSYEARTGNDTYAIEGNIVQESSGDYTVTYPRIILPESYFTDPTNPNKAMQLQVSLYDGTKTRVYSGKIGSEIKTAPLDYTLPRNTYLGVKASLAVDATEIVLGVSVTKWENGSNSEHNENIKQ